MTQLHSNYDLVIVGGGLIGMSLASALAQAPLSILLLEQHQTSPVNDNILDLRTTGFTRSSEEVFKSMGLWEAIQPYATPIEQLDVAEQGNFGGARIDAHAHQLSPIGYMIPNHALISVLSQATEQQANLRIVSPAALLSSQKQSQGYDLAIDVDGKQQSIHANFLVGADGARSKVRDVLNISAEHKEYDQSAIITNIKPQKPHNNIAYERFTAHGPLAVLPIENNHCALIWTQPKAKAEYYLNVDDATFLAELQSAFGYRLGRLEALGPRSAYPLSMTVSNRLIDDDAVVIGNAAQSVHPVAAQGFNLGLRDVQTLVGVLRENDFKVDSMNGLLSRYENLRHDDRNHVIKLTDGLTKIFAPQVWPLKMMRSIGVRVIGHSPHLQRTVLRRNLGLRYLFGVTE